LKHKIKQVNRVGKYKKKKVKYICLEFEEDKGIENLHKKYHVIGVLNLVQVLFFFLQYKFLHGISDIN